MLTLSPHHWKYRIKNEQNLCTMCVHTLSNSSRQSIKRDTCHVIDFKPFRVDKTWDLFHTSRCDVNYYALWQITSNTSTINFADNNKQGWNDDTIVKRRKSTNLLFSHHLHNQLRTRLQLYSDVEWLTLLCLLFLFWNSLATLKNVCYFSIILWTCTLT